ncbi:MAG: aldehyde ferredoxin oxidoreductase C-terminal domain-containing protein [Desulfarculaceae bacterium]|jgi:aldehyde:ferredoxin oxidoreductase
MNKSFGRAGNILFIDLTTQQTKVEPLAGLTDFVGGRGINQWLLFNLTDKQIQPLDPANPLILGAGTMVATPVPSASRLAIEHKNVITGGIGSGNCGGLFATEMKRAGYDHIVIRGKAEKPTYLFIQEGQVHFRDARQIWRKTTWDTDTAIKGLENNPGLSTLTIGPGGENLVDFACIIGDKGRAAAYGGGGAVMGSKNLKAIAVKGAQAGPPLARPEQFERRLQDFQEKVFNQAAAVRLHQERGTLGIYLLPGEQRPHGVKNLSLEFASEKLLEKVSRDKFDQYLIRRLSCHNCPVECSGLYQVRGLECEGIQANHLRGFGTNLGIYDPEEILYAHALTNNHGLDSDQTSAVIAWAMECYEKGIINKADTGGLELSFGNGETVAKLINMIANRQGFGDILAQGVHRAAQVIGKGSEELAVLVKKNSIMEAGMRSHRAWALGIVTSAKGCGHLRGAPAMEFKGLTPEASKRLLNLDDVSDPTSYENKAAWVVWQERYKGVVDMMGICALVSNWSDETLFCLEDIAALLNDITGQGLGADDLMETGEKIAQMERAFNLLHAGFDRAQDMPPPKFSEIPVSEGRFQGQKLDLKQWHKMLDEYYALHGWDVARGRPTRSRLQEMGLDSVARALADQSLID